MRRLILLVLAQLNRKVEKTFFHTPKLPVGSTFVHEVIEIC